MNKDSWNSGTGYWKEFDHNELSQLQQEDKQRFYSIIDLTKFNLFNKDTITQDAYIRYSNGTVVTGQIGWWCSDYIPVSHDNVYSINAIRDFAFYDANKQYISGDSTNYSNYTFTPPVNAAYLRFSGYSVSPNNYMLVIGSSVQPYQPYGTVLLKESVIPEVSVDGRKIVLKSINVDKLDESLIIQSNNLFNKDTVTLNAYINYASGAVSTGHTNWWCSDFIPIEPNTQYSITEIRDYAYYDENKNYVSGISEPLSGNTFTTPAGVSYLRFSQHKNNIWQTPDIWMFNKGSELLPYEPYFLLNPSLLGSDEINGSRILDKTIQVNKLGDTIIENTKNLFNKNTITQDAYTRGSDGVIVPAAGWWCSDFIPIEPNTQYNGSQFRDYAYYDSDKRYISGEWQAPSLPITSPSNAAYIRFSQHQYSVDNFMFNKGSSALPYEPYAQIIPDLIPKSEDKTINISLPDKIYAVVGDTLQLFYRGMIQAKYPYQYDILAVCSKGKMLERYFEFTPTISDVVEGGYNFTLYVKDDNGNILGQKTCKIIVVNPTQPLSAINVACFGDSLTSGGYWCKEAYRRLTGIGGTPAGLQFFNINFVGKKSTDGVGFFGEGGWTWNDFTTEGRKAFRFYVSSNINVSRGAIYTDGSQNYTISEVNISADNPNILGDGPYGAQTPPSSGILTKVSGSGDSTITFTGYDNASQNPLWNYEESKVDFRMYADAYCGGNIDIVYTLLSWNAQSNWRTDFSSVINQIKVFADALHRDFPNAKMKLMGIPLPDINGGEGQIEGAVGYNYADQYGILVTALNQNKAYQDFANSEETSGTSGDAYNTFVEFVNVSSQFDVEYNMPTMDKQVNTRCTQTEKIGTNDVHPNNDGYMQIADIAFRNLSASI